MNSRNASAKPSSRTLTLTAGETISVVVAKIEKHPEGGIIVNVPGNPRGFIPTSLLAGKNNSAKAERRELLMASPGYRLDVLVVKAQMVAAKVEDGKIVKGERTRIILNEDRITYGRMLKARQEAAAAVQANLAGLVVGSWMLANVTSIAFSQNGQCFGAFVELENGLPALLHKSEMLAPVELGDNIYVAIRALKKEGDATKVSVTQKAEDDKLEGLTSLKPGTYCRGIPMPASQVAGIEGWPVLVEGCLQAFLPLSEVGDIEAMRNRTTASLDVSIMPLVVGGHVRLTRRIAVMEVLARAAS
ncbi:MAG: hypothetical protein Q8T09_00980 [Candidatus Melainabacteria bacterium]|nr:hypothetical protein [Candidatus Melainabacteria bacterium]